MQLPPAIVASQQQRQARCRLTTFSQLPEHRLHLINTLTATRILQTYVYTPSHTTHHCHSRSSRCRLLSNKHTPPHENCRMCSPGPASWPRLSRLCGSTNPCLTTQYDKYLYLYIIRRDGPWRLSRPLRDVTPAGSARLPTWATRPAPDATTMCEATCIQCDDGVHRPGHACVSNSVSGAVSVYFQLTKA